MNQEFQKAKEFIESHTNFFLASHQGTDGDDCGSMLAMTMVLRSMGKKATPTAKGGVPDSLKFLPLQTEVQDQFVDNGYDAVILFGCNKKERTGFDGTIKTTLPILNVDHHPDNTLFGNVNLVDPTKSAVAELIFDFIKFLGAEITQDIGKCLLTGIFTDTGSFRHSNTKPSTLIAAAELMKTGARIDKIYDYTYKSKGIDALRAWGKAFENTRVDLVNKIAVSVITQEDLDALGNPSGDAFEGFVETLNTIPEARFALFLRQDGERVKGSMRSEERKDVDVSLLAKLFGGGGHKLAAGFEVPGKLIRLPDGGWKIE